MHFLMRDTLRYDSHISYKMKNSYGWQSSQNKELLHLTTTKECNSFQIKIVLFLLIIKNPKPLRMCHFKQLVA